METEDQLWLEVLPGVVDALWKKRPDADVSDGSFAEKARFVEKLRGAVKEANTREQFEALMTEWWAQAGDVPLLSEHRFQLVMMAGGPRSWRKARDLTLLVLSSHDLGQDRGKELWPRDRQRP